MSSGLDPIFDDKAPPVGSPLVIDLDGRSVPDDRFQRFTLIPWWEQSKLDAAKIIVVGAGALGNEIVKNLALLGVGQILIVDMDRIEDSNLSRSVLFRESDNGAFKAEVAARAAMDVYPKMRARALVGNVVNDLGLGAFRWADLVIGGLDNREARIAINRNCWLVNRPWIDGAIEQIQGTARVFVPDGPCYECTMSENDWRLVRLRRSCNLLTRSQMIGGQTPTTPTISAIIAGVQCQEAVKLLHGLPVIQGRGWVFDGLSTESFQTEFQRKPDCYGHETLEKIIPLDRGAHEMTAREMLTEARKHLGETAHLEVTRDIVERLICRSCGRDDAVFKSLSSLNQEQARCPQCKAEQRDVATFHTIRGGESFSDRSLHSIGVPLFDILIARAGDRAIGLELAADEARVIPPAAAENELEWT